MPKYVVLKHEDVQEALGSGQIDRGWVSEKCIEDAWVIRKQDTHAASTAYAYANAVQSTLEILEGTGVPDNNDVLADLEKIRDAAFEYAESARATQSRLPD